MLKKLGTVMMLSVFPSTPDALAGTTAITTLIKWLFAAATIVLILVGLVKAAMN